MRAGRAIGALLAAIAIAAGLGVAHAISTATASLDRVEGDGWAATGIAFEIDLAANPITARARIDRMQFSALAYAPLRNVSIECARVLLTGVDVECTNARIRGHLSELGEQTLTGRVRFHRESKALDFSLAGLKVGGGVAQIAGEWRDSSWSAHVQLQNGNVQTLRALLKKSLPGVASYTASGELDVDAKLQGRGSDIARIEWRARARTLAAANAEGTLATDALRLDSTGVLTKRTMRRAPPVWMFEAAIDSDGGQAYAEPIFMDLGKYAASLRMEGELSDGKTLTLRRFSWRQQHAINASGEGVVTLGAALRVNRLRLNIERAVLPGVYTLFAQPLLVNSALGTIDAQGALSGEIDIADNAPTRLALQLQDVTAADTQGRFGIDALTGTLNWRRDTDESAPQVSSLAWRSGQALGLTIGAAEMRFIAADRDFALIGGAHIPLFDGAIELSGFTVERAAQEDMALQLDATLQPVSVSKLCAAFGWPEFGGKLGGRLTDLRLRDGVMTLGTTLQADVFDGRVSIANPRLEKPFSNWPRFSASIVIDRVDLEQVTSAFSFGMITGRLSGEINDLLLFNWSPISFDAKLYTPKGDKSRHRISQRAVNNIGRLGGSGSGIAAALSSGFLRFFEEFNYDRLGISCKLENEVCTMSGVEPAGVGYYLVKGRSIPRIDVIGNASRVDWPRLVSQLKAATQSQGVQVQ